MENIRRSIKLFFTKYGKLLLIVFAIIAGFLLFLRLLDKIAEDNYRKELQKREEKRLAIQNTLGNENRNVETKKIEKQRKRVISSDEKLIEKFLSLCEENTQEAYDMLSDKCKKEKFLTVEEFKSKYVDLVFAQAKDHKIEEQEQDRLYKVLFYVEDILQAGSLENRKRFEEFYYIEEDPSKERKIYINYNIEEEN